MTTPNNFNRRNDVLALAREAAGHEASRVALSQLVEACYSPFSDPETYGNRGEMYRIALAGGIIRLSEGATELLDRGPQGQQMWTTVRGDHEVAVLEQAEAQLSPAPVAA